MIRTLLIASAVFFLSTLRSHADDKDPIKEKLDKAKSVYEDDVKKSRDSLISFMQKKEDSARKSGDLKQVAQIKAERDAFEADGTIPKSMPTMEYVRQTKRAMTILEGAYRQAIKEYLQAKKDVDAEALGKELEELQKKTQPPKDEVQKPKQVWVGTSISGERIPIKLEIMTMDGVEFVGNYYCLFKDGSINHHAKAKGKIEKGTISFRTDEIVKDGGMMPAVFTGKMTGNKVEGTWETLQKGFKGPFNLEVERKKN